MYGPSDVRAEDVADPTALRPNLPRKDPMTTWSREDLRRIAGTDDLHISPLRADGLTFGTPTWICGKEPNPCLAKENP